MGTEGEVFVFFLYLSSLSLSCPFGRMATAGDVVLIRAICSSSYHLDLNIYQRVVIFVFTLYVLLFLPWWPFDFDLAFLCIEFEDYFFTNSYRLHETLNLLRNHFLCSSFVFCTLHRFVPLRPIEELTDHVVYSEPKVRDPNSNRKVCHAKISAHQSLLSSS